jgi:BMFP domain-containing protein YqiC
MTDVQTRKEVESWIQYALIPVVKRLEELAKRVEALEARLPPDLPPKSPHSREAEQ